MFPLSAAKSSAAMSVLSPAYAMPAAAPRPSEPSEVLLALRRAVGAGPPGNRFISLGVASLDQALAGGLA
jgi:hypothetical protein